MAYTKATNEALADKMAFLIAKGATQSDAYREIKPKSRRLPDESIHTMASAFARKFQVQSRVARIRAEMRPHEIYSVAAWLQDSIAQRDQALDKGNYNAGQAYQRQIGQAVGAIGGDVSTTLVVAEKLSDSVLIERLAGSNPQLAAMLADALGVQIKPGPQDVVPANAPGSVSKLTH